jgi:uncharacterized membrane protein
VYVDLKRFTNKEYLKGLGKANLKLKRFDLKQLWGIVVFIVGVILIFIAIHAMHKIAEAKDLSHNISNFFEHNPGWNPILKFFGGKAQERISQYDTPVMLTLIGGIILIILGVIIFLHYRNRIRPNNRSK